MSVNSKNGNAIIKKGNTVNFIIKPTSNGSLLPNLGDATEVIFSVKKNKTDADANSKIIKKMSLSQITVNDPKTGYISVPLSSTDTNIDAGQYFLNVEAQFGADIAEFISESDKTGLPNFIVLQDGIHS